MSMKYNTPFYLPTDVIVKLNNAEVIFLIIAFLAGLGLLMIKRWGWYLFVFSSITLFVYNGYFFIKYPQTFSRGPLLHTTIILFAFLYFLQKDIILPYIDRKRKGFRHFRRYPITIPIKVNEEIRDSINISIGGMMVYWSKPKFELNEKVSLDFELGDDKFAYNAGIAVIQEDRVGIAFRGLEKQDMQRLKKAIYRSRKLRKNI